MEYRRKKKIYICVMSDIIKILIPPCFVQIASDEKEGGFFFFFFSVVVV